MRAMDVYLVRHAIAFERDAARWPDDAERPLTDEGRAKFVRAARGLQRLVPEVELVLASRFRRAWQTAAILSEAAGWSDPVAAVELEAGRGPEEAVELLEGQGDRASVALVGHEPHLSSLASLLLAGSDSAVPIELKKGGVIALLTGDDRAVLRWHATPRLLRTLDDRG